ncbi:MAG: hypothetical protein EOP84_02600 [Verrucomicrobiaceae bacterium]|nr:MAG: hypothetical protein EOP84_02600 [Verrucomicrobiaceae bacterium]
MRDLHRPFTVPLVPFKTIALSIVSITIIPAVAGWRDDIGFTRLQLLAGLELPTAVTDGVTQVEAKEGVNFAPDPANALFTGKTFTVMKGPSGASGHATGVGTNFYGTTSSLLPGSFAVDSYYALDWMYDNFLNVGQPVAPLFETRAIQNHSWIGPVGYSTVSDAEQVNTRLDFAIDRDGFSCVVGVNNGNSTTLPYLLCQSYHTISVGLTNGNHSAGFTTLDTSGRIKPDIVAPDPNYTSFSTPMVSSTAGLLQEKLSQTPHLLTGADLPRVTKALLLATATKDNLPTVWSNTSVRPLDLRYGAGQVNAHHAWQALRGGNVPVSAVTSGPPRGWSAESIPATGTSTWFFTVPTDGIPTPFCAALTWHRSVTDGPGPGWGNLQVSMANLNLRLHHAEDFTVGTLIAESISLVDNVEMVNQPTLPAGTYALVVENTSATPTKAALAWHSLPAVTIEATDAVAEETDGSPAVITVTRSGDTGLPLLVPITTTGGTAVSGTDFQALPATVTIPAGSASTTLTIAPVSDSFAQGDRSITLAVGADFALVRDPAQTAAITLVDKPFDAWRFANFDSLELANPTHSSGTADPDNDTLPNLIEYALGLSPESPDSNPITVAIVNGYLQLTATKNPAATDVIWGAEVSGDLETWTAAEIGTDTSSAFAASDPVQTEGTEKRFMRIKVTK